ncbi:MAG: fructosamine kinase family protein [Verrucomicrobia bacterium]|nr:fructosamine kinase family protein [Verrucomicrobiota bacterium]
MWQAVCESLSLHLDQSIEYRSNRSVSGGCINNAQVLETNYGSFFVKLNEPEHLPMFEAEAESLKAIYTSKAIRCPQVILSAEIAKQAILVLEYIPMQSAQPGSMAILGQQLAALHGHHGHKFGWHIDNNLGLTPQPNTPKEDWISFFRQHRLEHQMSLCERKGLKLTDRAALLKNFGAFFTTHSPRPSLLHGDLWGGNVGFDSLGEPILFDPACYYGDREADLAFTEMFGGFSPEFYKSYNAVLPLDEGYRYRKRLYNLYHELNHFYLFGGGYGTQAQDTIRFLLGAL